MAVGATGLLREHVLCPVMSASKDVIDTAQIRIQIVFMTIALVIHVMTGCVYPLHVQLHIVRRFLYLNLFSTIQFMIFFKSIKFSPQSLIYTVYFIRACFTIY